MRFLPIVTNVAVDLFAAMQHGRWAWPHTENVGLFQKRERYRKLLGPDVVGCFVVPNTLSRSFEQKSGFFTLPFIVEANEAVIRPRDFPRDIGHEVRWAHGIKIRPIAQDLSVVPYSDVRAIFAGGSLQKLLTPLEAVRAHDITKAQWAMLHKGLMSRERIAA